MAKARAMATRCCMPPDSWKGYFPAASAMPTSARYRCTSSSTFPFERLRPECSMLKATFLLTLIQGNSE